MRSVKTIALAGGLAGLLVATAAFMNVRNERTIKHLQEPGSDKGFAVVELFTSEGCSSCPPADKLLEKIQADNRNKQIYILAFHVDYWDHQGWKDRFSDPAYSARQGRYAEWLNLRTIYTPQIVINGTNEYVGSNQGAILGAIAAGLEREPAKTLTLNSRREGNRLHVSYQLTGDGKNSELVLALVQQTAKSNVKAGENSGRNLSHVQIVRQMLQFSVDTKSKEGVTVKLPDDFTEQGWELIGLVQDKADGHITAAARVEFQ